MDRSSMWMLKYREEVRDSGTRPGAERVSFRMEDSEIGMISESWWSYCARRKHGGGKKAKSPLWTKGARSLAAHCIGQFPWVLVSLCLPNPEWLYWWQDQRRHHLADTKIGTVLFSYLPLTDVPLFFSLPQKKRTTEET